MRLGQGAEGSSFKKSSAVLMNVMQWSTVPFHNMSISRWVLTVRM